MESKLQTEKVMLKKEKLSANVEQIVENDMSLPDYFGDIVKILCTGVQTNIYSAGITGDKAVIDGNISVRVLYINSASKTEIFECSCPFNRSVDVKDASDADIVSVVAAAEQITCRAVNQRRADIRGSVTLKVTVTGVTDCNVITDAPSDYCQTLKHSADGSFLAGAISRSFTFSSSADIEEGIKAAKIFRATALATVSEVKTIKNKMMIKGGVSVDAVLLTEDGNFVSQKLNIPVNQITDMEGIDEETNCCVSLKVNSIDMRLTPDTPQSSPSIEASVIVTADIDAYRKASLQMITEAYSPSYELLCTQNTIPCVSLIQRVNENYTVTSKMDFSSCKAQSIADAAVRKIRYTVNGDGRDIVCKGNIHFGLVVVCEDGSRLYFERISDFEYKKQMGDDIKSFSFAPEISVNAVNCSVNGNSEANISTELHLDGFICILDNCDAVTFIEQGREIERDTTDGVITVYFASKGESLWNIAKEHGSSMELIRESNDLTEDVLSEDRMLIFAGIV